MKHCRWPLLLVLGTLEACSTASPTQDRAPDASHDSSVPRESGASARDSATKDVTTPIDARLDAPDAFDAFTFDAGDAAVPLAKWNTQASIFVNGFEAAAAGQVDCRTEICQHNEDTDMIAWGGAIYMVHRTARSQILGPNSSLLIYRSVDDGATFKEVTRIDAPMTPIDANDDATMGRDIRDPAFFITTTNGVSTLRLKALTRLPTNIAITQTRDSNVESITVGFSSTDGTTWSPLARLAPNLWSFWRVKELGGVFYSAAYHDGDSSVSLFSSPDGVTWTLGAQVFGVTADTPLETEIVEMPNGNMLALVRTDGDDADLEGNDGNQRTHVCWAQPPYTTFTCPETVLGERLDGPVAFFWQGRLFVIARRHVDTNGVLMRKRTSLFELSPVERGTADAGADGGVLVTVDSGLDAQTAMSSDWGSPSGYDGGASPVDGGAFDDEPVLAVKWWGDLPSAGDTAYAGVAFTDANHARVVWYSGDIVADESWVASMLVPTSIWLGTIDFSLVH
jgi:hypothetical protein